MNMKKGTKKQPRGGARPGAGAPRKKDPLVRFWISVRKSKLKELGGEDSLKASIYAMVETNGKGLPLPKDFINPKKIAILDKDGSVRPLALQPSALSEKRESLAPPAKTGGKAPAATPYMQSRLKGKLGLK